MTKNPHNQFQIKKYTVGEMAENCYIVVDNDTQDAIIIDPGDEGDYLSDEIEKQNIHPVAVVATHGHFDHILAALDLQLIYNIPFRLSSADEFLLERMSSSAEHFLGRKVVELPPKVTGGLTDGELLSFGHSSLSVIQTPGHTPGSVSLYSKNYCIFTGDTLFASGGVGRTDFAYSSKEQLDKSLHTILQLPDNVRIYSGHGADSSVSTEKLIHQSDIFSE
jgi:hydroxyacylglutathione hydrolase